MGNELTPTEDLIAETLTARYRLGENSWTLSTKHRKAVDRLEGRGYIRYKESPIYGYLLVWMTDQGKAAWLNRKYEAPFAVESPDFRKRAKAQYKEAKKLAKKVADK